MKEIWLLLSTGVLTGDAAVDGVIDVILVPDEFRISAPDMPDTDTVNDRELSVYVVEP